jgi:hypothetical protein
MKKLLIKTGLVMASGLALSLPVQAQDKPLVSPSLKKMLGALPIAGIKDEVLGMVDALKKTPCGGNLAGCYSVQKTIKMGGVDIPLKLYFFTSKTAQQTFLLVVNKKIAMPRLVKANVQKLLGDTTTVSDFIISISTADFELETANMPADLRQIVKDSYFDVNYLAFSSGVQMAGSTDLGGVLKGYLLALGVKTTALTMRAGAVMPIPTDLVGGAGTGIGLAASLQEGKTMREAGDDAAAIEAYVELQLAPKSVVTMRSAPNMELRDATFFINNSLTFGYKGNARFSGMTKDILLQFQTPLQPEGAMDLLDFSFRMAMPETFTVTDFSYMAMGMMLPVNVVAASSAASDASIKALKALGGGYIRNIQSLATPLKAVAKPLSVFQLRNPKPLTTPYKFGDKNSPFPANDDPFNVILLGPLADGGPLLHVAGDVRILGQTMGKMDVTAGVKGLQGMASAGVILKLGPLGRQNINLTATIDVTTAKQEINLKGKLIDQNLALILASDEMTVDLSASCLNPFEIKTTVKIEPTLNIANIFEGQGGANVDPSKLQNCMGKELEAAYNKIAGEYKTLGGYTANQANAALKKIADDAAQAAAAAKAVADKAAADAKAAANKAAADAKAAADKAAAQAYSKAKDDARNIAQNSSSAANNAFKDAGNAFKGIGKKSKHSDANDKFDPSVFNWDYFYDTRGMAWGNTDLVKYWSDHFAEGLRGSFEFDLTYYRKQHPGTSDKNLLNTWLGDGINRGEQASTDFSLQAYRNRNPDLEIGDRDYRWALDHWLSTGKAAGRSGRP